MPSVPPRRWIVVLATLAFLIPGTPASAGLDARDIHDVYRSDAQGFFARLFGASSRSYALVIGISEYTGEFPSLDSPHHDAVRVTNALIEQGFDEIVTLTNGEANMANITYYMEEYFCQILDSHERFLLFFAGHGTQRELRRNQFKGYLPMAESARTGYASMISMDQLSSWSRNIINGRQALFMLDACLGGLAGLTVGHHTFQIYDEAEQSHSLLTAATASQDAHVSRKAFGGSILLVHSWTVSRHEPAH